MYCDFYQMTERPFAVTPDPKCLYLNARYREALAALHYGITQRKGFITLIGEAGTGKTTLLKRLLEDFDAKTRSVFIFNTHVSFEEILEYLFAEFDLPVHNGKKLYMLQRLNTFLLEELRGGGNVALLIDEAQDLEHAVLEDLRLLSNLETAKEKILQIVLSGQPELGDKLSNPNLRQLRQRIAVSCRLLPLSRDEISEYIQYRLHAVGCNDLKLFTREAEDQIYHFSRGIPRLINVVCDNALVIGYALGKKRIGGDVIEEAAADLMPVQEPTEPEPVREAPPVSVPLAAATARPRFGLIAVVLVAIVIGLLSVGRTMWQRGEQEGQVTKGVAAAPEPPRAADVIRPGSLMRSSAAVDAEAALPGAAPAAQVAEPAPVKMQHDDPPPAAVAADPAQQPVAPPAREPKPDKVTESGSTHTIAEPSARDGGAGVGMAAPAAAAEPAPVFAAVNARTPPSVWTDADAAAARQPAPQRIASIPKNETPPVPSVGSMPMRLATSQFDRVTVQPGDSISRIAIKRYGQSSLTILDLLKLANPALHDIDVIAVGQTIQLPDLAESSVLSLGEHRYGVLVYSTTQLARASALDAALRARGRQSSVGRADLGARRPILRVMLDGFSDRAEATAASRELQRLFREDSRLALLVR